MIQEDGNNGYKIEGVPLTIEDEPAFPYRSIMIDTSRHYLSVDTIKKTIDSMILNKLNVLHWHITDDESFPLLLKGYSQITKAAAYSDKHVFTYEQVKEVLDYAKTKGV
jgi:hexosaminidase